MKLLSNLEKEFKEVFGEIQDHSGDTKFETDFENLLTEIDKELKKTIKDEDVWPSFTGKHRKGSSTVEHAVHDNTSLNTEEGRTQQLKRCRVGNNTYDVGDRWKDDETGKDMICILMNIPREVQTTLADADITVIPRHDLLPVGKTLHARGSESKESIGEKSFNSNVENSVRKKHTGGVNEALTAIPDLPEKPENTYRSQEVIDEGGRENKIETLKSQDEQDKIMLSQIEELPEKHSIEQNLKNNDEDLKTKVVKTIKEETFSLNNAPDELENGDTYIKPPNNDSIGLKDSYDLNEHLNGSSQIPQETVELVGSKNKVHPNRFIKETVEKHRRLQRTVETIETITTE